MTDAPDIAVVDKVSVVVAASASPPAKLEAFSFGDAEPVLDRREILDSIECWRNGKWYEPPISLDGLTRTFRAAPHHSSALMVKVNQLAASFVPSALLTRQTFKGWALDYLVLGNGYLERQDNMIGRPLALQRAVGKYVRRGIDLDQYFFLTHGALGGLYGEHVFPKGAVFHLQQPDLSQEIYGVPEYLSALQSAFLNEAATVFRRRYYLNGSHAGFILYVSDAQQNEDDINTLRQALKDSKGPGNFRNLFLYSPNGKKDGVQLIPVSEVAAKDEFIGIKNTSRDDILAAHRVPPQLLGVVPANAGGFGDVGKAADTFHQLEILPLQSVFLELNEWLGQEVVRFEPYEPLSKAGNDNGSPGQAGRAA